MSARDVLRRALDFVDEAQHAWQGDGLGTFEGRSNRALQCRQFVQHGCSSEELARTEGFEPPPSGSVIRRIIQLCYVRFVRFRPQVTAGELVETAGNAPAATILQGSSAPLCCPHSVFVLSSKNGAWGTYRACSSRFSVGCNDLICHPGVLIES